MWFASNTNWKLKITNDLLSQKVCWVAKITIEYMYMYVRIDLSSISIKHHIFSTVVGICGTTAGLGTYLLYI